MYKFIVKRIDLLKIKHWSKSNQKSQAHPYLASPDSIFPLWELLIYVLHNYSFDTKSTIQNHQKDPNKMTSLLQRYELQKSNMFSRLGQMIACSIKLMFCHGMIVHVWNWEEVGHRFLHNEYLLQTIYSNKDSCSSKREAIWCGIHAWIWSGSGWTCLYSLNLSFDWHLPLVCQNRGKGADADLQAARSQTKDFSIKHHLK